MTALSPFACAGATPLLTGAASGIGEQLAHQLAARGSHLIRVHRDAERLESAAVSVRRRNPAVTVDVRTPTT